MTRLAPLALAVALSLFLMPDWPLAAQEKAKPDTAGAEQSWQVEFVLSHDRYTGTMTLTIAKDVVTGTMLIDSPTRIDGKVEGKRTEDAFVLEYPFTVLERNCTGRVKVDAKVTAEGNEASGTTDVVDCDGQQMKGTVSMKKAPAEGQ